MQMQNFALYRTAHNKARNSELIKEKIKICEKPEIAAARPLLPLLLSLKVRVRPSEARTVKIYFNVFAVRMERISNLPARVGLYDHRAA